MRFGPLPVAEAEGAVLAHSVGLAGGRLRKGRVLSAEDVAALAAGGIDDVTVARLDPGDLSEDAAAVRVATAMAPDPAALGLSVQAPFTGRVNLHAETAGVLRVDADAVARLNAVDEAVTLATLPDLARVAPRDMVATVKILPYAVPGTVVEAAIAALEGAGSGPALRVHGLARASADLIATRIPGMKESLVEKGLGAIRTRLGALGVRVASERVVAHHTDAVAAALDATLSGDGAMALILGASATQDRADVGPAAVVAAGGRIARFGMPVDPGNLLFLGDLSGRPVIGLPGCVRSPALNGADWVLERLACGIEVTGTDIAAMGAGGLLKEIPTRPQPRAGPSGSKTRPRVEAILLAAGSGSRMRGADKLLEEVAGEALLTRIARESAAAGVAAVHAVLPAGHDARRAALAGLDVDIVENAGSAEGMGSSIRAGMARIGAEADAVILVLADMPEIGRGHLDRLIAAFDPGEGREICRAVTADGRPGHPVLFGRRFFESLGGMAGDTGAREVLRAAAEQVVDVPTEGQGAVTDLDTPEAWADWRAGG